MTCKFTLPGILPGLNDYITECRANRYKGSKLKKYNELWIIKWLPKGVRYSKLVFVQFLWVEPNRKRDKDNIAFAKKFIFDAMVTAGVLKGDGWNYVHGFKDDFDVDKKHPRIEVEITEVDA